MLQCHYVKAKIREFQSPKEVNGTNDICFSKQIFWLLSLIWKSVHQRKVVKLIAWKNRLVDLKVGPLQLIVNLRLIKSNLPSCVRLLLLLRCCPRNRALFFGANFTWVDLLNLLVLSLLSSLGAKLKGLGIIFFVFCFCFKNWVFWSTFF